MVNFCANLIVELTLYFFFFCSSVVVIAENRRQHFNRRIWIVMYMSFLIRIEPEIPYDSLQNPQSILPFVSFFSLSFVHGCFCAVHAMHSHSEHIHFLASNNISNKKKRSDIQTDTFRLELHVLFFFLCAFSCLFCALRFFSCTKNMFERRKKNWTNGYKNYP